MYNELQLTKKKGKNGEYTYAYDLVCPSDYMIQRMINEKHARNLRRLRKSGRRDSLRQGGQLQRIRVRLHQRSVQFQRGRKLRHGQCEKVGGIRRVLYVGHDGLHL